MRNATKTKGQVISIRAFGSGTYLLKLRPQKKNIGFLPGQFLNLTLDDFDCTAGFWPEGRVFSIASEPGQDDVTIVYSVKGAYTRRMEKELFVGKEVWLKYPYGDFIIRDEAVGSDPLVLIAGGTGISPFMPYLMRKDLCVEGATIHLYYGVRRPSLLLFGKELSDVARKLARIHLHYFAEEGASEAAGFVCGRPNIPAMQADLGRSFRNAIIYLSGPPLMIKCLKGILGECKIAMERIRIDQWG